MSNGLVAPRFHTIPSAFGTLNPSNRMGNTKIKSALVGVGIIGGVLLVGGGLAGWKYAQLSAPATGFEHAETVEIAEVKSVEWRPMADLVGTVFALKSVTVANEVAGTVSEVNVESGQVVEAGAVLFALDASTERAELGAAEAAIHSAESNARMVQSDLALAETKVRRMRQAVENKAAPEMELDEADAALVSAKAHLDRTTAEIETAKARAEQIRTIIRKKTLVASFRARAGIHGVQPGQYLKEGSEIIRLESVDDTIYLDFAVPQEHMARVKVGDTVMASSALFGDKPVRIEVVAVDASVNRETRNVRLRALVPNRDGRLRPGMFVDVQVPVGESSAFVAIPNTAVRRAPYGDHVFVAVPGETPGSLKASQRFIRTGPNVGSDVIVLEGLSPGDRVATVGSFKLSDGVGIMAAAPAAPNPEGAGASVAKDSGKGG